MFNESLILIIAVEAHLIDEQLSQWKFVSYFQRLIWFPFKFLKLGMAEKIKAIQDYAFIAFALLAIGAWVINNSGVARTEVANAIMLAADVIPVFLVMFALPSMYAHSGIDEKTVSFVKAHLQNRGFSTEKEIDILQKSLKPIESRARERVTAFKWLVGLVWAGFIYTLSQGQELLKTTPSQFTSYIYVATGLLIATLSAYFVVWGYEASLDKLFRAIEFGCNDFCHETQSNQVQNG
jgi:hypothetical protein